MILHKITNVVSTNYKISTIFKTYETDLDGISNKLGFNKRSFAEWGTQVKQSFDEAGGGLKSFLSALSTAFSVKNDDKEFKKYNGQIVTKNNIDDYLPKLDETSAENQLNYLQDWQKAVDKGTKTWDSYFKTCKNGRSYLIDFVQNTDLQKASTEDLIKANEAARQSALDHNAALKQQTLGAKAASAGLSLLKTAGNAVVSMGIAMLASFAINGIITLIANACQSIDDKIKSLNEDLDKSVQNVKSISDEFNSLKNSADEIIPQYAKLAQGVDKFGKNVSLTDEEYKEFIELNNKIGEMFPLTYSFLHRKKRLLFFTIGSLFSVCKNIYNTPKKFK